MGKYRAKLNPFTGTLQLVNDIGTLFFKESVPAYANLPITGNSKNDARITDDTGHLYVWSLDVPDGALTDWIDQGDIIDLKWAAIEGKPSSAVADIDDAVAKRHTQNSDTKLAEGTGNEVTAANAKDAVDKKHTQGTDQGLDTGGLNQSTAADVKDAVDKKHAHLNKIVLDAIQEALTTALKNAYDGAVADSHTHSNKVTLDAIQEAFTTALKNAYDSCVANEHTHANKTTLDNIEEAFTTALKSAYDSCVTNEHTHTNKTVLDSIQEALTTALKTAYDGAVSHAALTSGNPHNVNKSDVGLGNVDDKSEATIITDVKADPDIDDALDKKHSQGTDQKLDEGGINEVAVADVADAISKKHSQNTDEALRTDKLTVDVSGNTEIAGELKIKVYSQDAEPTLGADQRLAMWIDTNDSNRVYFIFRRGVGDQVLVELS